MVVGLYQPERERRGATQEASQADSDYGSSTLSSDPSVAQIYDEVRILKCFRKLKTQFIKFK